ncbi:MAG: dihydroneopterin aldolase [Candidatus Kariarchaeaceae archaeon]|jgi:FolB domain-containing protein
MDKILIKDLLVRGIVGINDWEREKEQDILVNMVIEHDLMKASLSDNIDDTLNYRTITKEMIEYLKSSKHYLVETLAHELAGIAIRHGAQHVTIRLEKPNALRFADSVGVELIRTPDQYE